MPVLRNLALAALAAGAVAAVRKRQAQGGRGEADLWAQATSGPNAVSTPTTGR